MAKDAVLTTALARYKRAHELMGHNRKEAADDIRFVMGEQWPKAVQADREADGRPCITINRTQQMVKQVVNDMRQNRAAIKVHPKGGGAQQLTAELRAGLIRQIEADSNASDQYSEAGNNCVISGEGYLRIRPEYEGDESFDQRLLIERIKDPLTVTFDPDIKQPDGSDAGFAFVEEDVLREDFRKQWPKAKEIPFKGEGSEEGWSTEETVKVAEYYSVEDGEVDTLYQLRDGTTVLGAELGGQRPPKGVVLRERKIQQKKCVWRKITAAEVLEETEWKIPYILIVPVLGEEYVVQGKTYRMGLVRHTKDPARVYNYSRTATTEQVALAPKAPYILAEGQAEGYEDIWGSLNTKNHAYITYKPTTIAGQPTPPPSRQQFSGVPAGAMADLQLAAEEIKAVTGIYDAALGAKSNETSGKAILARQRETDNATYHYVDALNRAVRQCGRVVNELIPIIYDTARQVRILSEDGTASLIDINQQMPNMQVLNDVTQGRYDVVISTGPSYETKRIEAVNSLMEFMRNLPNVAPIIADLVAKNMDWPGAEQLSRRLSLLLPPQIQQAEGGGQQVPPEVQARMEEQMQVIQQLQQAVRQFMQENQDLQQKVQADEQRAQNDAEKNSIASFQAQTARIEAVLRLLQEREKALTTGEQEPEEAGKGGEEAAMLQQLITPLQQQLQQLHQSIAAMQMNPQQPVMVHVGGGAKVKQGRAVKNPDGSWTMVSQEVPAEE